jgi:hypothetical protein
MSTVLEHDPVTTPEPGEQPSSNPNKRKSRKGIIIGGVVGGIALAAIGTGVGMNAANQAPPQPDETEQIDEPEVVAGFGPMSEEVLALENMPKSEFFALSFDKRNEWCDYYSQDIGEVPVGRIGNTADEKMQIIDAKILSAFISHDNGSIIFDKDQTEKMVSCAYIDASSPAAAEHIARVGTGYDEGDTGFPAEFYESQGQLMGAVVTGSGEEKTDNNITTQNVTVKYEGFNEGQITIQTVERKGPTENLIVDYGIVG